MISKILVLAKINTKISRFNKSKENRVYYANESNLSHNPFKNDLVIAFPIPLSHGKTFLPLEIDKSLP